VIELRSQSQNIVSAFRQVVQLGKIAIFRDFLSAFLSHEFNRVLEKNPHDKMSIATAQRLKTLIASKVNIRGFVRFQSGMPFGFVLPFSAARMLGLTLVPSICANLRFIAEVIRLSLIRFIKALLCVLAAPKVPYDACAETRICLLDISAAALNSGSNDATAHTLENWLRSNYLSDSSRIFHSVLAKDRPNTCNRTYVPNFLPFVPRVLKATVIAKSFLRLLSCLLSCIAGRWQRLFMIDDWIYSEIFRLADSSQIYDRYIFTFQGSQYRPYWSYLAEEKGGLAVQLNYAANTVPSLDQKYQDRDDLNTATWSELIPFSSEFAPVVRKALGQRTHLPKVVTASPVYFNDNSGIQLPDFQRPAIAIFDVAPLDERFHVGWMDFHDYSEAEGIDPGFFNRKFLLDAVAIAKANGFQAVMKPKRADPRVLNCYTDLVAKLVDCGDLLVLPPDMAPSRLLEKCIGSVVWPFSSVGYFSKHSTKMCFYDVAGKFGGWHEASMGVSLVSSYGELSSWVESLPNSENSAKFQTQQLARKARS